MARPEDVRYLKSHEWARREADGTVRVGISDFAVDQLNKEIVFVDLPKVGRKLRQGESFGAIESVKAASDLYAPVAGTIAAVNDALADNPVLVADSPYGDGWMIAIEPASAEEDFGKLLAPADYDAHASESAH